MPRHRTSGGHKQFGGTTVTDLCLDCQHPADRHTQDGQDCLFGACGCTGLRL